MTHLRSIFARLSGHVDEARALAEAAARVPATPGTGAAILVQGVRYLAASAADPTLAAPDFPASQEPVAWMGWLAQIEGLILADSMTPEELACAAWPQAVGKKVAGHTRAAKLVRARLVVEVEDKTWQYQLLTLSRDILKVLEKNLGPGLVDDLEFRVVPRRRDPQRAAEAMPGLFADEASAIEDPVMRSIYKAARKKALA